MGRAAGVWRRRDAEGVGARVGLPGSSRGTPEGTPPTPYPAPLRGIEPDSKLRGSPRGTGVKDVTHRRWDLLGCQGGGTRGKDPWSPGVGSCGDLFPASILQSLHLEPLPGLWPRRVDRFGEWPRARGGRVKGGKR